MLREGEDKRETRHALSNPLNKPDPVGKDMSPFMKEYLNELNSPVLPKTKETMNRENYNAENLAMYFCSRCGRQGTLRRNVYRTYSCTICGVDLVTPSLAPPSKPFVTRPQQVQETSKPNIQPPVQQPPVPSSVIPPPEQKQPVVKEPVVEVPKPVEPVVVAPPVVTPPPVAPIPATVPEQPVQTPPTPTTETPSAPVTEQPK